MAPRSPVRGRCAARGAQRGFWRGLFLFALLLVLLAALAGAWLWRDYQRFLHAPLRADGAPQVIDIARGQSFRGVLGQLRDAGLDGGAQELYWRALGWQRKARIQASPAQAAQ